MAEYKTVTAMIRPPRLAVAYRSDSSHWTFFAREALRALAGTWGGSGAVLVPAGNGDEINPNLLPFLHVYDPDYIATHDVAVKHLVEIDPTIVERSIPKDAVETTRDTYFHLVEDQVTGFRIGSSFAKLIDEWCSPFTGLRQDEHEFREYDVVQLDLTSYLGGGELSFAPFNSNDTIYNIAIPNSATLIQLITESRYGYLRGEEATGRRTQLVEIAEEKLPEALLAALTSSREIAHLEQAISENASATAGEIRSGTPFALGRHHLAKVRGSWQTRHVCVIGDTAEDHALALLCDRIFGSATWFPRTLLDDQSRIGTVTRMRLRSTAWRQHSTNLPCAVVSVSETRDYLDQLIPSAVATIDGEAPRLPQMPEAMTLKQLLSSMPGPMTTLADARHFDIRRTVPFLRDGEDRTLLTPLQTPYPTASENGHALAWCTDVFFPGASIPARTAIRSASLAQNADRRYSDSRMRASLNGTTFASERIGFISTGSSIESRLAHPLVRFPGGTSIARELAAKGGSSIEISSAGRRASNSLELWGSFAQLAEDLAGKVRILLDSFLPPNAAAPTGDYSAGYSVRGHGYLTIEQAEKSIDADAVLTRQVVDRLASYDVLERGFILSCVKCLGKSHYNLDMLDANGFACPLCRHHNSLSAGRWPSGDREPRWSYGLTHVVRELLQQHGDVPLIAAAYLARNQRLYEWSPEIELTYSNGDSIEIDLFMVVDGRVIVGEAKSNSRLTSAGRSAQTAARRLVQAALALTADEIVLITSQKNWSPNVIPAVDAAVEELWTDSRKPTVSTLTCVTGHSEPEHKILRP